MRCWILGIGDLRRKEGRKGVGCEMGKGEWVFLGVGCGNEMEEEGKKREGIFYICSIVLWIIINVVL